MDLKFPPPGKGNPPPMGPGFVPPKIDANKYKRKWLDIPYASQSPAQKMDIYLPDEGDGPFPVIMQVHGGAFMLGSKGEVVSEPMIQGIYLGYAVADINYRLSGEAIFPALVYDGKAAVRFLRANAAQYHLDGSRIAAWGQSAGGHLAANLGAVETVAGPPATTSHVECTAEERKAMGIPEGLIRYSVGIEDTDDLIADLKQAFGQST